MNSRFRLDLKKVSNYGVVEKAGISSIAIRQNRPFSGPAAEREYLYQMGGVEPRFSVHSVKEN
jgi:hypothetical protein